MSETTPTIQVKKIEVLWTMDGIGFLVVGEVLKLVGGDVNELPKWCKENDAYFGTWNSAFEVGPCYFDYTSEAMKRGLKKVVLLGINNPSQREWKKVPTP